MCNISIFSLTHIVLYCSNKYCDILIYCNIVSSLLFIITDVTHNNLAYSQVVLKHTNTYNNVAIILSWTYCSI